MDWHDLTRHLTGQIDPAVGHLPVLAGAENPALSDPAGLVFELTSDSVQLRLVSGCSTI